MAFDISGGRPQCRRSSGGSEAGYQNDCVSVWVHRMYWYVVTGRGGWQLTVVQTLKTREDKVARNKVNNNND